jgi:hypothetical protein
VASFDAEYFGVNRLRVLQRLRRDYPAMCRCARNSVGEVEGYIIVRRGLHAFYLGPWIAVNADIAEQLFQWAMNYLNGQFIFCDIPLVNGEAMRIVTRFGFTRQRGLTRMYLGSNDWAGRPSHIFATSSAEKG